jgi:hypothetical protein
VTWSHVAIVWSSLGDQVLIMYEFLSFEDQCSVGSFLFSKVCRFSTVDIDISIL